MRCQNKKCCGPYVFYSSSGEEEEGDWDVHSFNVKAENNDDSIWENCFPTNIAWSQGSRELKIFQKFQHPFKMPNNPSDRLTNVKRPYFICIHLAAQNRIVWKHFEQVIRNDVVFCFVVFAEMGTWGHTLDKYPLRALSFFSKMLCIMHK